MADYSIPSDGSERHQHLLSVIVVLLVASLAANLVACTDGPDRNQAVDTESASGIGRGLADRQQIESLAARLLERDADSGWPNMPADDDSGAPLGPHEHVRFEAWELMAVLRTRSGDDRVVHQRFDRLALRGADAPVSRPEKPWWFRDVVRSHSAVSHAGAPLDQQSYLQRRALGLARIDTSGDGHAIWQVGDQRLQVEVHTPKPSIGSTAASALTSLDCSARLSWHRSGGATLQFERAPCPAAVSLGDLRLSRSDTLGVQGQIDDELVEGIGWFRHLRGNPEPGSGPVGFDRLVLQIDSIGLIRVSRSKRRSGRGPMTVVVELDESTSSRLARRAPGLRRALEQLEWLDIEAQDQSSTRPSEQKGIDWCPAENDCSALQPPRQQPVAWRLRSPDGEFDVNLQPLSSRGADTSALDWRWFGGVRATGSHQGAGFLDYLFIPGEGQS